MSEPKKKTAPKKKRVSCTACGLSLVFSYVSICGSVKVSVGSKSKVFQPNTDYEVLKNNYIPNWLSQAGIGSEGCRPGLSKTIADKIRTFRP